MVLYRIYRIYKFFDKKTRSMASVNEQLGEKLHKPVTKNLKEENSMRDLKAIFWQQIQLKWDHCLLRIKIFNIFYVSYMFSLNMHDLNL